MDFNNNQDFGFQDMWLPATPVKNVPARRPSYSQRNQASEATWLDLVAGVQTATPPWGFTFQNEACSSISLSDHLQALNGSQAVTEASGSQTTVGCSITGMHNAGLINSCSPKIVGNVLSNNLPPLAPFFEQNGNCHLMPGSSDELLLNGRFKFSQGSCNSTSNCAVQKTQYGSPVTFNPNLNPFPETAMSFAGIGAIPSLLNPMIADNCGQRRQDKHHHQHLENGREGNLLMDELHAEVSFSNLIASSEYAFYQKSDCVGNLAVHSDEISYKQIGTEKSLVEREDEDIELNDGSKQKSRRKKHRPKVIIEGKTARRPRTATPKPKTPKPAQDKANASVKRKYTRRKKDTTSLSETNELGEVIESESGSGAKSVRRSLNFDLEEPQTEDKFSVLLSMFMKNLESPAPEAGKNENFSSSRLKETNNCTVVQGSIVGNPLEGHKSSMVKPQNGYLQTPLWPAVVNQNAGVPMNIVNSNCVSDVPPRGTKRDHYVTHEASELETTYLMHSYNAGDRGSRSHDSDRQGSSLPYINKRMRMETGLNVLSAHNHSPKLTCRPSAGWRTIQASNYTQEFTFTDAMKLMAKEKLQALESLLLCEETDVNAHNHQAMSNNLSPITGLIDYRRNSAPVRPSWQRNDNISHPPTPDKSSGYSNSQESKILGRLLKFETSEDVNKPVKAKGRRGRKKKEENTPVNPFPSTSSTGASIRHGENLNHEVISFNCQDPRNYKASTNSYYPSVSSYTDFVDYIVQKLRRLSLNRDTEIASSQAQNAIVPYIGNSGMMVPYEGPFELAKTRKPRPKVDLDPETNRVWKLLMGIEGEGDKGVKVDKEKWWEEERQVFRGRVDSFIARMHLVQGDRRFSQWKGSVVDSVIGVFLTQNVSDHLSSSAYMALAARFPLRSGENSKTPNTEQDKTPMENHKECIETHIDTPKLERNILDHIFCRETSLEMNAAENDSKKENSGSNETPRCGSGSNSVDCTGKNESHETDLNFGHDSPNSGSNTGVTVTRSISSVDIEDRRLVEEVVSSQNSVVSSQSSTGYQILSGDHIVSNLMLNVEADDLLTGRINNGFGCSSFTELLHIAESNKFQELYSHGSMSSANSQVIHKIENGYPVLDNLDNSKDTRLPYQADFSPNHTTFGLSNMLGESQFFCSLSSSNSTILGNNASTLQEELGSSLHGDKFEVNHSEGSESAAENLVTSDNLNKLLPTFGSASAIDSYLPIRTQSKEQSTFSEIKVDSSHQSFSHKKKAEITDASSNIDHFNESPCMQPEDMKRLQQKDEHSTFVAKISQDANKVQIQMDNYASTQIGYSANQKVDTKLDVDQRVGSNLKDEVNKLHKLSSETPKQVEKARKKKAGSEKKTFDWDSLRKEVNRKKPARERSSRTIDSLDWEAVRCADVSEISEAIRERGMNNMLAERIKDFLNRLVREHGSIDLEWLRDVPPDKSKDYLLSVRGLGLKSAECVRLLTLHHLAFPVDTNVGRICVRLGWVPLQPLPESLQLHLLELYPVLETIQKYLWPRLCKLDQRTLYELHYQMITFGKVFCTKSKPNCNACPMRGECRHFASAFASARLALPPPEDKSIVSSTYPIASEHGVAPAFIPRSIPTLECSSVSHEMPFQNCEPIIEEPATPEPECQETLESAIEDAFFHDVDEIPTIKLNFEKFTQNLQNYMQENMELQDGDMSKALVALTPEAASIPMPKLKNISRLRTEHQVYEIPDSHRLLEGLDQREPDDPSPYLLAIWTPGETAQSIEPPQDSCKSQDTGQLCEKSTCFACNSIRESQTHTVRGTLLIPCRTAMRGSFPLNGTYFQVNEVFADHHSSRNPIDIPRDWIWNLSRRTVCFGTSIPTIFRGLTTEGIQHCFWRGFVCVRGFDRVTRAPKPLYARLHFPASKALKYRKGGVAAASTAAREGE